MIHKSLEIIATLNSSETTKLRNVVCSPYHNKNEHVIKLFDYLTTKQEPSLNEKECYQALFPKQPFKRQRLHDYLSMLFQLLQTYLALTHLQKNDIMLDIMTLKELRKRKISNTYIKTLRRTEKKLNANTSRNEEYFHQQFLLASDEDSFFLEQEVRESNISIQKKADALDNYYLASKLKTICEMLNRQRIINVSFQVQLEEEIISYIKDHINDYKSKAGIYTYFLIYNILSNPNSSHYQEAKTYILEQHNTFPAEEQKDLFIYLQNFCIRQANKGQENYLEELFNLYTFQLSHNILTNPFLTTSSYKTIVTLGIRLHQLKWTKRFIEDYKNELQESQRENAYQFNLANFYYQTKNLREAKKLLMSSKFTDVFFEVNARALLIRIYADLEETDLLESSVNNFVAFIKRNKKLGKEQQQIHLNFALFTKNWLTLYNKASYYSKEVLSNRIQKTIQKLSNTSEVLYKNWITEKLKSIENHY